MKHTLLFLSSIFCATLSAQESAAQLESMETYMDGECKYKNCYTYDENGNKATETRYNWEFGKWAEATKTEYTYDKANHLTADATYNWSNGQWTIDSKSEYAYDTQGRVETAQSHKWNNDHWNDTMLEYSYAADGTSGSIISYYNMMGMWIPYTKTDKTYDTAGKVKESTLYMFTGDWTPFSKWINTYDVDGRSLVEMGYSWGDDEWVNNEKYEYAYNTEGHKIAMTSYALEGNQWVGSEKWEYIYDNNGNLIEEDYFYYSHGTWVKYGYYLYSYTTTAGVTTLPSSANHAFRKILKNGSVIITNNGSTHTLGGARIR